MDKKVMDLRVSKWRKILETQIASGLPKERWCDQNGISRSTFFHWQKRIRDMALAGKLSGKNETAHSADNPEPMFAELPVFTDRMADPVLSGRPGTYSTDPYIRISYHDFNIYIPGGTAAGDSLSAILKAVRHAD